MKKFKKIMLFLFVIILTLTIIYAFPLYKVYNITDYGASFVTSGESNMTEYQNTLMSFITSDASNDIKKDVSVLLLEDYKNSKQNIKDSLTISVYYVAVISILTALIGIYINRKMKGNKILGLSLMTSSVVSIIILISVSYGIYVGYLS